MRRAGREGCRSAQWSRGSPLGHADGQLPGPGRLRLGDRDGIAGLAVLRRLGAHWPVPQRLGVPRMAGPGQASQAVALKPAQQLGRLLRATVYIAPVAWLPKSPSPGAPCAL